MEESTLCHGNKEQEVEEEEYVLIDLDAVLDQVHIPPNAPYVLSVSTIIDHTSVLNLFFWLLKI